MSSLFTPGNFPVGEILEHPGDFNTSRVTSEEKRAADRMQDDLYDRVRHASEVHRQVNKPRADERMVGVDARVCRCDDMHRASSNRASR